MGEFVPLMMGIIFIGLGICALWFHTKKLKRLRIGGYETIATITEISGAYDWRKAFITYIAEEKEQTVELSYYSNNMRVGDKVRIFVDNKNPQDYVYIGEDPIVMCILFIVTGIVLLIVWTHNIIEHPVKTFSVQNGIPIISISEGEIEEKIRKINTELSIWANELQPISLEHANEKDSETREQ